MTRPEPIEATVRRLRRCDRMSDTGRWLTRQKRPRGRSAPLAAIFGFLSVVALLTYAVYAALT